MAVVKTELKITLFRAAALAVLLAVAWMLSGCVSVYGHATGTAWGHPYLATRLAATYASQASELYVAVPVEFVGDTVFLPADLIVMPFAKDF
jgi:uncharacterized protein YceK